MNARLLITDMLLLQRRFNLVGLNQKQYLWFACCKLTKARVYTVWII